MEIAGRKALVLGAGKSGVASALFLAQKGAMVALHDKKSVEDWSDEAKSLKETNNVGQLSGEIPYRPVMSTEKTERSLAKLSLHIGSLRAASLVSPVPMARLPLQP